MNYTLRHSFSSTPTHFGVWHSLLIGLWTFVLCLLSLSALAQTPLVFEYNQPGNHTFTLPPGTTQIQFELWGSGADGDQNIGGNGGNYLFTSQLNVAAYPGANYQIVVGGGNGQASSVAVPGGSLNFIAIGGIRGAIQPASPFVNFTQASYIGGTGGASCNFFGVQTFYGGGGGSARFNGNGSNGTSAGCSLLNPFHGAGGNGTGVGGAGNANNGSAPGGGGGGGSIGGKGARGLVKVYAYCNFDAGQIGYSHTVPTPQERIPDIIQNVASPFGTIVPPVFSWERKAPSATNWTLVSGASGAEFSLPNLTSTTQYRRLATGCNITRATSPVNIKVLPRNGTISGAVRSQSAVGVGVQGITIRARKVNELPGSPAEFTYTTTTGPDGTYSLDVYFGDAEEGNNNGSISTRFYIIASREGHTFNFDTLQRNLTNLVPNAVNVDFIDLTSRSITGQVSQTCVGCLNSQDQPDNIVSPLDGVSIFNNGAFVMRTANLGGQYGRFAATVLNPGVYRFRPSFENHKFVPDSISVNVQSDVQNVDFSDTNTYVISGKLADGCKRFIGYATLEFADVLTDKDGNPRPSEFRKRITTNDSGFYAIRLPARKYKVRVVNYTHSPLTQAIEPADLLAFFNTNFDGGTDPGALAYDSLLADITTQNASLDLFFQRRPSIQLVGLEPELCGGSPLPYSIVRQSAEHPYRILIWQGSGCPLNDNFVRVITNVTAEDENIERLVPINNGSARDTLVGGSPNILGNFRKFLGFYFRDKYGRDAQPITPPVVVLGVKTDNASSFATVSPQIPIMVLHDPPGDQSYSFWSTNQTIEKAMRWNVAVGGSVEGWAQVKVGTQMSIGLGVSTESEVWGTVNSSVSVAGRVNNASEAIVSTTTSQTISTSPDEDITGDDGDLFIGAALNLLYTRATEVQLNGCELEAPKRLMIAQNGFATQYVYTDHAIRNNIIPTLRNFVNNPGNTPEQSANYQNQVKVWEQVLANNEENKRRAAFDKNISFFGSSGAIENSTTSSSTRSSTIETDIEIERSLAIELGFEVAGNGVSGGVNVKFRVETGVSETLTNTRETTIGYVLDDNDALDNFSVNIRKDPVYNTPVFQTVAGQSSCPPEANTQPRDEIYFVATNPLETNVPTNADAIFNLELGNLSIDPSPRTYMLSFDQTSNPSGAQIFIGGSPYTGTPFAYTIDQYDIVPVTINVRRNPGNNTFTYEGLRFVLSDACGGDVSKTAWVSANFQVACSNITLAQPEENWLCNTESNNIVQVLVKDYNLAAMQSVTLEYARVGTNNWRTGFVRLAADLSNNVNGTTINWNVAAIPDGNYHLRLRLNCNGGVVYTQRITGRIDRVGPLVFGNPQPTDRNYVPGDEISFQFNEDIRTDNLNQTGKVALKTIANENIPVLASGFGNRLVILPQSNIMTYSGQVLMAIVNNIEDLFGNEKTQPDTIRFTVGTFSPANGPDALEVVALNAQQLEGSSQPILFQFTRNQRPQIDVLINFTLGGKAIHPDDYLVTFGSINPQNQFDGLRGTIILPRNLNSVVLRIHPKTDNLAEGDEEVVVTIADGGDYRIGADYKATGIIIDNALAVPTIAGPSTFCAGTWVELMAMHADTLNPAIEYLWSNGQTTRNITVNQIGNYSVTITNTQTGASAISEIHVLSLATLPQVFAGSNFALMQNTGDVALSGSPLGGTWSGSGVTGNMFTTQQPAGQYTLTYCVTTAEGCTACASLVATITETNVPVATPVINPGTGTYSVRQQLTITCATPEAAIYYTTNGSLPRFDVPNTFTKLYTGPLTIKQTTTVRAVAIKTGMPNSSAALAIITIEGAAVTPRVATPVILPSGGSFSGAQSISITCATPGATIYYTTNGSNPRFDVPNSFTKLYTGPFTIYQSTTIRAVALASGFDNSSVAVANFTLHAIARQASDEPVKEAARAITMSVYPNPGNGIFTLQVDEHDSEAPITWKVTNLQGKEIASGVNELKGAKTVIDIYHEPAGVYLLQTTLEGVTKTTRLVKR